MIQKRIVEICIFILYWFVLMPLIVWQCVQWGWVQWDEKEVFTSIKNICAMALGLAAGYLVVYIVVVIIYLKLKTYSMKIWVTHNPATANMINQERQHYGTNASQLELQPVDSSAILELTNEQPNAYIQPPPERDLRNYRNHRIQPPPPYEEINNHI